MIDPIEIKMYETLIKAREEARKILSGYNFPNTTREDYINRLETRRSKQAGEGAAIKQHPHLLSQLLDGTAVLTADKFADMFPDLTAAEMDLVLSMVLSPELVEQIKNNKRQTASPSPS